MDAEGAGTASMPAHCACGRPVEAGHHYCPACGSLVGHLGDDGAGPAWGTTLVDTVIDPGRGPGAAPVEVEGSVKVERSGLLLRLVGAGMVVVVGVLAWTLFRQPAGEIAPDLAEDDESVTQEDETTTTTEPRSTTTATRRRRTTTTRPDPATTGLVARADGADGPLLGEETGLTMLIGGGGSVDLRVLDLDSGELRIVESAGGYPVGAAGSVVILTNESGRPRLFDLADPSAEPIPLTGSMPWAEVAEIGRDRVWVFQEGPDGTDLVAYDLAGDEVERRRSEDFGFGPFGPWSGRRDVLNDAAGGVYVIEGDGYRRLSPGFALAVGQHLALIRQCDQVRRCRLQWFDLDTEEVLDFPPPDVDHTDAFATVAGDDRWLVQFDWRDGNQRLFDVTTGDMVRELDDRSGFGPFGPRVSISDDGRWLLERRSDDWTVVDLDTMTEWPIDVGRVLSSETAVLVDLTP